MIAFPSLMLNVMRNKDLVTGGSSYTRTKCLSKVNNCARVYRLEHNYIVRYTKISQLHVSALMAIFRFDTKSDEKLYTGCPTTYQTRQFFNNFTTNEDIATKTRRTTDTHYRHVPFHFSHNERTPVQISLQYLHWFWNY